MLSRSLWFKVENRRGGAGNWILHKQLFSAGRGSFWSGSRLQTPCLQDWSQPSTVLPHNQSFFPYKCLGYHYYSIIIVEELSFCQSITWAFVKMERGKETDRVEQILRECEKKGRGWINLVEHGKHFVFQLHFHRMRKKHQHSDIEYKSLFANKCDVVRTGVSFIVCQKYSDNR